MGHLEAGRLKERITLLTTAPPVQDGRGGSLEAWPETELTRYARVRPLRGGELLALGQILNPSAYEITIRNYPGFVATAKQRVRWKGIALNVQRVAYDENREYILLTCLDGGQ